MNCQIEDAGFTTPEAPAPALNGLGATSAGVVVPSTVVVGGLSALTALMFLPKRFHGSKRKQYAIGAGIAAALLTWKLTK